MVLASSREQSRLRAKLGDGVWMGTSRATAQSTDYRVAQLKASVFRPARMMADLCGGLGADTIGIAQSSEATTFVVVEKDPVVMAAAAFNLWSAGVDLARIDLRCEGVNANHFDTAWAVHLDPDRRPQQSRVTALADMSPSPDVVAKIIERCGSGWLKLAPATRIEPSPIASCCPERPTCRVWLSADRSVREQAFLWGATAERLATKFDWPCKLETGGRSTAETDEELPPRAACFFRENQWHGFAPAIPNSIQDTTTVEPEALQDAWILDPDPAIRASGLTEHFAAAHGARIIGQASGFLASFQEPSSEVLAASVVGRVVHLDRYREKRLKAWCRAHDVTITQCKVRVDGTRRPAISPENVCRQYSNTGSRPHTMWIGQWQRSCYAAITESIV